VAPFQARHSWREPSQCLGSCARARAKFEHVITQRISGNYPRQQTIARDALPETRRAKPIFERVQFPSPMIRVVISFFIY
jgi:hypothetical protein